MYSTFASRQIPKWEWHTLEAPLPPSAVTTKEEIFLRNNSLHLSECISIINQTNQNKTHSSVNSEKDLIFTLMGDSISH